MVVYPSDEADAPNECCAIYRENVKNIIFCASHIENTLAGGITKYFFGDDSAKRIVMDQMIVSTDFFSFSAKRKAFLAIIKEQGIITGKTFAALEHLLSKVVKYRNMFTHGIAVYRGTNCILNYYESTNREKVIDDAFLDQVENDMNHCFKDTEELVQQIKVLDA